MKFSNIHVERSNALTWLTLDRPQEANALSFELAGELLTALDHAESDPECHVLILQGAGKFFCAGGDVSGMADAENKTGYLLELAGAMHKVVLAMGRSRLIIVAAIDGPAAGAGLGLVLNADFAIATPRARFLSAYSGVGLTPDCGVSYLLPLLVGPRRANQMCLNGTALTASEALEWGLIGELTDPASLRGRVQALGESLAGGATQTLGPTKRLLGAERLIGYEAHLDDELRTISAMGSNPDTARRIAAFVERSQVASTA